MSNLQKFAPTVKERQEVIISCYLKIFFCLRGGGCEKSSYAKGGLLKPYKFVQGGEGG